MLSPCWDVVALVKAPVAINKILFSFLSFNSLKKYPEKTVPIHAQPLPPECVSCLFLSKIKTPQSL